MGRIGITFKATGIGGRLFGSLFFLVFLGMGLLFCVLLVREVYLGAQTYRWPQVDCVILESIVREAGKDERPYHFQVRYEYEWKGKVYSAQQWSRNGGSYSDYEDAKALAARYPLDGRAKCFVNPTNPFEALLQRPSLWLGLFIPLPLVFVVIGGAGLVGIWSKPGEARKAAAPTRTKPISSPGTGSGPIWLGAGFFALFFVIGLVVFYFITARPLVGALRARSWVKTPCTVVSSRVQSQRGDDGTTYRVDILYRYEFAGQEHRSGRYKFMGGSSSGYQGKAEIVNRYPAGSQRTCYVDPNNPAQAVLERGLTADMWFGAIPGVFMLVGAGGIIGMLRSGNRQRSGRYGASDPVPMPIQEIIGVMRTSSAMSSSMEEPYGSRVLKPASSRLAALIGIGIFAVIWNGLVWFVFLPSSGLFRRGSVGAFDVIHVLFMLPFLGVGFVLIGVVIYQWLSLYNPKAEVTITPGLPALGGKLDLAWRLTGRTHVLRDLKIVLEAREEATYRQGTRTSTDKKVFFKMKVASASDAAAMSEGRATVVLPVDSVPTFNSRNNKIIWSLTVLGEIPRWPNLKEEFVIEVRPPTLRAVA